MLTLKFDVKIKAQITCPDKLWNNERWVLILKESNKYVFNKKNKHRWSKTN